MADNPAMGDIAVVIIGRNEGQRLERCITSVMPFARHVVYVDSGSTDGSLQKAQAMGAEGIALDLTQGFTAARARNAGFDHLMALQSPPEFVQFIDGDCEMQPGWIETAATFLRDNPAVAVVCGRRRERFPTGSIYNRLIDAEWDTPVGQAKACGGDAMMRAGGLQQVGGFNPALIAGEEPELCVRLRAAGWHIWRLDAEMTLHDADITRFSQWWARNKRAGFTYAEGAMMHGKPPERHNIRALRSTLAWGLVMPAGVMLAVLTLSAWWLLLLLVWPLQVIRLWRRDGDALQALFVTLGKFPEAQGALRYGWERLRGKAGGLIEYK